MLMNYSQHARSTALCCAPHSSKENTMPSKTRFLGAVAAATAAGLVLAGCSAGSTANSTADSSAGGTSNYVYAVAQDFQGADRASFASEAGKTLADIMQSRLLTLTKSDDSPTACTTDAPTKIDSSSALVSKWGETKDGLGIDVTLRKGVESAAGNTLTAADVAWTIKRILAVDPTGQTLWFTVGGFDKANPITVTDDEHFTLNLTEKNALAPYALAGIAGLIYDSKDVEAHATTEDPWGANYLKDHTANYGPWNLTSFDSQKLVFSKNKNYASKRGNVQSVTVETVPDASTRIQLVQSGQASETNGLDYTQLASLQKSKGVTITNCASTTRDWLGLNSSDPVLGKTEVREAISLALDRKAIASSIYQGFATPATSGLSKAYGTSKGEYYAHNVKKAKQLLDAAGEGDGFGMTLSVSPGQPGAYAANLAALVQQQLAAVGIKVTIKTVPSAVDFRNAGIAKSMQSWLMAETPAFANAGYSAWLTNGDGGFQNYAGYENATLNADADKAMTEGTASSDLTQKLADEIDQDQPAVYMVDRNTTFVRANCVTSVPTSTLSVDYAAAVSTCK